MPIPHVNLENLERRLENDDKGGFLQLTGNMLCWMPEERPTAEEAIFNP